MQDSQDTGKYQIDNDGPVQGQIIGDHNKVEMHLHRSSASQGDQGMSKIKALFLAANPTDTPHLAIDQEMRTIEHKVRAAEYRDALVFQSAWAVRPDDLLQLLGQHQPHIVHFSGHGSSEGLCLAGENGQARFVTTPALKALFTTLKDNIRLVFLNACYSREQALALVETIDCVVGMKESIRDDAAIAFASSFYRAIGFGRSVQEAFEQGITSLLLEGIPQEDIPEMLVRQGVDAKKVFLIAPANPSPEPSPKPMDPVLVPQVSFGEPFPKIWHVPRRHTSFFTGRDHMLEQIASSFRLDNLARVVPPQALSGLPGIGKTQTAAEYAYRYRGNYDAVCWIRAETLEDLDTDLKTMAEQLQTSTRWLLILDNANADDLSLISKRLPTAATGHLLLTTRARAVIPLAQPLELKSLEADDGALFILRRAGYLKGYEQLDKAGAASVKAARELSCLMEGLPLALEQAGAYIEDTGRSVRSYLDLYQKDDFRPRLHDIHSGAIPDYPESIARAWRVSWSLITQRNSAAADLLRLCAFLAPDAIPEEIVTRGASVLGSPLDSVAANPIDLDEAIGLLRRSSLLQREVDRETDLPRLSIHRVIQQVLQDEMDLDTRQLWAERAVQAVAQALPSIEWQVMQAHVRQSAQLITHWNMTFREAKEILCYLQGRQNQHG